MTAKEFFPMMVRQLAIPQIPDMDNCYIRKGLVPCKIGGRGDTIWNDITLFVNHDTKRRVVNIALPWIPSGDWASKDQVDKLSIVQDSWGQDTIVSTRAQNWFEAGAEAYMERESKSYVIWSVMM